MGKRNNTVMGPVTAAKVRAAANKQNPMMGQLNIGRPGTVASNISSGRMASTRMAVVNNEFVVRSMNRSSA